MLAAGTRRILESRCRDNDFRAPAFSRKVPGTFPDLMPMSSVGFPAHDTRPATGARRDLLLVAAATLLAWGVSVTFELSERVLAWTKPWERYELDELPGVLLVLAAALAWYAWRRVREVREQLTLRRAAEARLAETLAENRRLSISHVEVQEAERRQLARELHDELGQHLNAIKLDAVSLRGEAAADAGEVTRAARAIAEVTDHVQGIVRDMLRRLRPVGLDELGLAAALEHLAHTWGERNPGTRVTLALAPQLDGLTEQQNMTLYRVVQESLNNVTRHASAGAVNIALTREAKKVTLTVTDDGAGSAQWQEAAGLGLVGMRERVEMLGGALDIASAPGRGFTIRATLPHARPAP